MTVAELIAQLSKCDPNARVVASTRCAFDDGNTYFSGFDQTVEQIEIGFSEEGMEWDLTFVTKPEWPRLIPSVRLVGHLDGKLAS